MTGRDYVIEMLGRTLAERDQTVEQLHAEIARLQDEIARLQANDAGVK